ncbi:ABC transporter permease [Fulvivirgaceae bacterium BMA12]|uniref:ABC transporter permease n=1 Tax=Agaribacillus aureus TaxID=3051825 RepID=A0ABT8KYR9_9BACT|nr:ABC transporter permease [Fulvivirgaceae bacterium BMA12]
MRHKADATGQLLRLLEWFCPPELYEGIAGDLLEKFEVEVKLLGMKKARRNFFWGVIWFFRPEIILRNKLSFNPINIIMLKSHLKVAGKRIWARKTNSFVNISGLTLGIVCTLIIAMVIRYELSFDSYHSNADRTYRIVRVSQIEGQLEYRTGVVPALPIALRNDLSGLEKVTAMSYQRNAQVNVIDDKGNTIEKFQEGEGCAIVDESFFEVFDFNGTNFKWLLGDAKSALTAPNTVVLTRSIAEKYFQGINVLGRIIKLEKMLDLKVTGIVEDLPANTDFPFKLLMSHATLQQWRGDSFVTDWNSLSDVYQSYVVLREGVSKTDIEQQIAQIHAANVFKEISSFRSYVLQPLAQVHSDVRFGNYNLRIVTVESIWALGIIGGFLLVMICINFINLSTAQAITRSGEVGIRKVMGSTRWQVVGQAITETLLMIIIASAVAMMASTLILNKAQPLIGFDIPNEPYADGFVWVCLLILIVVITGLAGIYPALVLSRYRPVQAMKKNLDTSSGGFRLRRILLVTQFTIMQILIISTFIAVRQMHLFKEVNMGFDKEAVINVEIPNRSEDKLATFRNDMLSLSSIDKVSFSLSLPSGLKRPRWFWDIRKKGTDASENLVYEYQSVDHQYLDLYDIKLLAGRGFIEADGTDYIIINQTLSSDLGFANPGEAVNSQVIVNGQTMTVIGVMQDFYSNSFKEHFDKVGLVKSPPDYRLASLKLNGPDGKVASYDNLRQSLEYIKRKWDEHFPESVFTYSFLDENVEAFYKEEARLSRLFQLFSFVFLMIGCLGLYGLVSFIVNRKTKEMAIRKVLGASVSQILLLFSKDYLRQIAVAFVLATPVAYYLMSAWLNGFAKQIELHWWYFVGPGVFVLFTALLSVGGQTWKSATANPSNKLRNE